MNLTSLLICSDDRALRVLRSVLGELEIDVEHCADLRSAAKELSQRSFGAVIVDCKDERSFGLLKSMRTGQHNSKSMAIAIIEARTNLQAAFKLGANFVVFKPISTEKAKSSFRAARALMKRERRRSVRLHVNIAAYFRFQNGDGEQVSITSLSEGGMAVRFSGAPGKRVSPVSLSFALPDTTTVIEATGIIAWQDARNHAGIQFAALPESSLQSLKEWLRQQSDEKHDPPIRCKLIALSSAACFLRTLSPFPPQTRVELLLRAADCSLKTQGRVQLMDPELGMGIEFLPPATDHRERFQELIRQVQAAPDMASEVLVEPEGMDWDHDPAQAAAPALAENAQPDPLLELFRTGISLSKAQFLVELEKHQLAAAPIQTGEPVPAPPFAYQRREPRIAVSLPVEVLPHDQLVQDLELDDLRGGEAQEGDTETGEFQADVLPDSNSHADAHPTTAQLIDVSHRGARIGGVTFHVKPGEVVNLVSDGVEARFLVIWVGERGTPQEGQIGLQSLSVD
ncbi:MAG TPA: PilZ domain-containing protein [Candidatus Sulfotelmatobacter sp.]|jgi:CheY-like chemotaxis protein|nr:PilZ domain-containing protein [Candidatus Sulfotelmatobacter sp.]